MKKIIESDGWNVGNFFVFNKYGNCTCFCEGYRRADDEGTDKGCKCFI